MGTSSFHAEVDGNVVRARGELDMDAAEDLAAALGMAKRSSVVLDLSKVSFMDARGLGVIAVAADRIASENSTLVVVGARGICRRVFELAGRGDLLAD